MTLRNRIVLFTTSAALTGALACAQEAAAFTRRVSSANCSLVSISQWTPMHDSVKPFGPVRVDCAVPSDDTLNPGNTAYIAVDLLDASNYHDQSTAIACVAFGQSVGAMCGATDTSPPGPWAGALHPGLSAWSAQPSEYPFVSVTLGRGTEVGGVTLSDVLPASRRLPPPPVCSGTFCQ